jgi:DsbC/DsbD-like thiol-disulfide interchange protein
MRARSITLVLRGLSLAACLSVCAPLTLAQDAPLNPVKWSLRVKPAGAPLKAGDVFQAELTAKIDAGWHLYSLELPPGGPRPTRITLATDQPFELSGKIAAPDPLTDFDPNFSMDTTFYEEAVTFTLPVKVTGDVAEHKLAVSVRYQVCTKQLCLAPKTVKLEADIETKN